ncbi:HNH endonuclease [Pelomonas aquatica]|uniref:HNH domain-containing protein n=1 Tax=Pelomonas aquatica TaxID=431058 RepID=A0A9X4R781_9BURK|nr:HNH endonuclease [Pelomonas aquatica]MCY4756248.1 HNH endonuclease [Pelomonas aquatica]MDG0865124.1 hypothetical protein [Pelomonas aquatica]
MAVVLVQGYVGRELPSRAGSLLAILARHGFAAEASERFSGLTVNLIRGGERCGYINQTVIGRGGVVGYRFSDWRGKASNGCPSEFVDSLVPAFCSRYGCAPADFTTHQVRRGGRTTTYLIITNPTLALRVLFQDHGLAADEDLLMVESGDRFVEGALRDVSMQRLERSAKARQACLAHYGFDCQVCGTNLKQTYCGLPLELIHVHHEVQLSTREGEHEVDPVADLKPVCPNCHAVIHSRTPAYSLVEVRAMLSGLHLSQASPSGIGLC